MPNKKSTKRAKKRKAKRKFDPSVLNRHHILWTASQYGRNYARRLRLHKWMVIPIPRDTLHKEIHLNVGCIPMPKGQLCKKAYLELVRLDELGLLDYEASLEDRINWLLDIWSIDEAPRTVLALQHQKQIVREFYHNQSP